MRLMGVRSATKRITTETSDSAERRAHRKTADTSPQTPANIDMGSATKRYATNARALPRDLAQVVARHIADMVFNPCAQLAVLMKDCAQGREHWVGGICEQKLGELLAAVFELGPPAAAVVQDSHSAALSCQYRIAPTLTR